MDPFQPVGICTELNGKQPICAITTILGDTKTMWSKLTNPLSMAAIVLILFVALVIGMTTLSQNGGGAWGFDDSISPEEAAQNSFNKDDHRLLGIRLTNFGKSDQRLNLGAICWPESLNMIEYETNFAIQKEAEGGAYTIRAEYARRYNLHLASQLVGVGKECKIWRR